MADTPYPIPREQRQTSILLGDGVNATYGPFSFKIFDIDDVRVRTRVPPASKFSETAVTVAKVSGLPQDFFTITFPGVLPASTRFIVTGARLAERSAGITKGTQLSPAALEKELSKQAINLQELRRDVVSFDPNVAEGDLVMRAGNGLVKGPDGQAIIDAGANAERAEAAAEEVAGYDKAWTVFLDVIADGVHDTFLLADETGPKPVSVLDGQFMLNVHVGGALQTSMSPTDWPGIPYRIIEDGTKIQFSFVPKIGLRLYAKGAAGRASDPVDQVPANKVYLPVPAYTGPSRTYASRATETVYLRDYGAIGDGISHPLSERFATLAEAQIIYPHATSLTDETDWAALQAAINFLAAATGGIIECGFGHYALNKLVLVKNSNIFLNGQGKGGTHSKALFSRLGGISAATAFWWSGADNIGATMLSFKPDAADGYLLDSVGMDGIGLYGRRGDASNVVGTVLDIRSTFNSYFDVFVEGGQQTAVYLGVAAGWAVPGPGNIDPGDLQKCKFRFDINQQWSAKEGNCLVADGTFDANVSVNIFDDIQFAHINKDAILLKTSDSNIFSNIRGYRNPIGTGKGIVFGAGPDGRRCARANIILSCLPGDGGVVAQGTTTAAFASHSNTIHNYNRENLAPNPVIETGAKLNYHDDTGKSTWTDVSIERNAAGAITIWGLSARVFRMQGVAGADSFWVASHGIGSVSLAPAATAANVALGISTIGTALGALYSANYGAQQVSWNSTGVAFNGSAPVGKQTLSAALSTGGAESNVNICTAINAIRTALRNNGLGV